MKIAAQDLGVFGSVCLVIAVIGVVTSTVEASGFFMILSFASFSLASRNHSQYKKFTFSLAVLACVSAAMTFPQLFLTWG